MKLGILGATGWIGQALGLRLIGQGIWPAEDLLLANRSGARQAYAGHPEVTWSDASRLCGLSDILVLAVRPEDFPVPGFDGQGKLVISCMTVWTLDKLAALAPGARIVRAMPNGAAPQGRSYTPWVAGDLSDADAALTTRILSAIGPTDRVASEDQLDYLAALSGSGSAYPALMAQILLQDARRRGLPEPVALRAVEAIICGSAPFLEGRMQDVGAVLDSYHGYRGVTAAGLEAAEPGMTQALRAAMAAATAKARALGQQEH